MKTPFWCARDDREQYDDDGHVARRGNFVRTQPSCLSASSCLH